jgi:hypothetical protein
VISKPPIYGTSPAVEAPPWERHASESDLSSIRRQVPEHLWPGLRMLLQAYEYAEDTGRDHWDFAVEVSDLYRFGMTRADCRWFICKGWASQARELEPQPGQPRCFDHNVGLAIDASACLVLTEEGSRLARLLLASNRIEPIGRDPVAMKPHWDRERHELWFGSRPIKQFKLPSPNQEMILMALEEEDWPPRIDDPLPPARDIDPKRRLRDTIKNLNRNQKHRLLRFMGDGTGQGVRWEVVDQKQIA